jgi:hypothetical protein
MIEPFISFLLKAVIITNAVFGFGLLLRSILIPKKENHPYWRRIFVNLSFGLLTLTVSYAFFKTKGLTILFFIIIPVILYFLDRGFHRLSKSKIQLKDFICWRLNVLLIVVFSLFFFSSLQFGKPLTYFHPDLHYYENISYFLNQGYENTFGNLNELYFKDSIVRQPYHFGELWLVTLIGKVFHETSFIYSIQFVTIPLLIVTVMAGLLSIWERFNPTSVIYFLFIGLLLLFVGPTDNYYISSIIKWMDSYTSNLFVVFENSTHLNYFLLFKNLPFYIISIGFIHLIIDREYFRAINLLMVGLPLNFGLVPGVSFAVFGLTIIYFIKRRISQRQAILLLSFLAMIILGMVFFYFQLKPTNNHKLICANSDFILQPLYKFFTEFNWKGELLRIAFRIILPWFWLFLMYLPFLVFFVFVWINKTNKKEEYPFLSQQDNSRNFLIATIFILTGGVLTRPFLVGFNSPQFVSLLLPFVNVVIIYLLAKEFNKYPKLIITMLVFILFCNYPKINIYVNQNDGKRTQQMYSERYKSFVISKIENKSTPAGWIMGKEEASKTAPLLWMYSAPSLFINNYGIHRYYNLNDPCEFINNNLKYEDGEINQLKYYLNFYNGKNLAYDIKVKKFIEDFHLEYIIIKKDVKLLDYDYLNLTVLCVDDISGDRFCKVHQ